MGPPNLPPGFIDNPDNSADDFRFDPAFASDFVSSVELSGLSINPGGRFGGLESVSISGSGGDSSWSTSVGISGTLNSSGLTSADSSVTGVVSFSAISPFSPSSSDDDETYAAKVDMRLLSACFLLSASAF